MHEVLHELVDDLGPADVAHVVEHHREHLELVPVGIDDRMVELRTDRAQLGGRLT